MKRILKRWEKVLTGALIGIFLLAGGFMGVDKFMTKERSLTIFDEASVVSGNAPADESASSDKEVKNSDLKIDAKSAVLIDGSSGKVLFAQNEKEHLPPASVTKVMTLLLILEACDSGKISLDDKVTVSERAAAMLKGVIMVSANDGCVAFKNMQFREQNKNSITSICSS